jgi:isopenicillin N synthase-like dioxygenase
MPSSSPTDFTRIPVIDVSALAGNDPAAAHEAADEIRRASVDAGFFYVTGHGVSRDLMRATHMAAKYFFRLPDAAKQAIKVNAAHRGYVPFAQTTQPGRKRPDLKESFNFAFPFTAEQLDAYRGHALVGPNQWPQGEPLFRDVLQDYYRAVFELGQQILGGFALALDLPRDFFRTRYRSPLVRARLLHYPPQPGNADDGQFGAAEHTDYGTITILWQDDVGGLQVRNRAGDWIDAPTIEDAFVINIGDMLARWSNDLFVSTPHRVVNASGRERFSIPVFYDPDYDTVVECLANCATPDNPPRYPPIVAGEYITGRYDDTYSYRQPARAT